MHSQKGVPFGTLKFVFGYRFNILTVIVTGRYPIVTNVWAAKMRNAPHADVFKSGKLIGSDSFTNATHCRTTCEFRKLSNLAWFSPIFVM